MRTFDPTDLLNCLEGDEEAFREIKELFFQSVRCQIDAIYGALEDRDCAQLVRRFHTIKGACANFGAKLMTELSQELELAAKSGDLDKVRDLLDKLDQEFAGIKELVSNFKFSANTVEGRHE
ncbi:MAG: Hpt domain-containing protein [Desulfomonile tiedjei]|uniref:Hpt domain-containing protein n=1 Tax=Desulfomonile tiedjei TaxID=2358 RepID=A0A9D6Z3W4_9BACT|nr:Hpt domain-containing protein [Desulfomonile tiedjei]